MKLCLTEQGQLGFDDTSWPVVDIPHDASATGAYGSTENAGEGFLPLARTWYWESQATT